jgi:hypothetical protein
VFGAEQLQQLFEELADDVAQRLKASTSPSAATDALPTAATDALRTFLSSHRIDASAVLAWIAQSSQLPPQEDLLASFGEPPITIVNRPEFYIQLLFWADGTTRVHQHAFSGAFAVLSGSSIHVEYTFEPAIVSSERFMTGRLSHKSTEYLRCGDCRAIIGGSKFIHSVFHLDHPTVSVVIRNHGDPGATTQLAYRPTVAIDLFDLAASDLRKQQILDLACESENSDALLASMIGSSDIVGAYLLLEQLTRRRGSVGAVANLVAHAEVVHGAAASAFSESLSDLLREENIVERRKAVREPHHRHILALLLTVPNREGILALLRNIEPESDPVDVLIRGLREMLKLEAPASFGANALGIELGPLALTFLEDVLRGASIDEAALGCEDAMQGQMLALQLPMSQLLRPLFRAS